MTVKTKRRRRGRPTKLTPELQKEIVKWIRAGCYVETVCSASGIARNTYKAWLRKGAKAKSGKFRDFLTAVKKAVAESENLAVGTIRTASKDRWQAAAWILERKHPERWARADRYAPPRQEGPAVSVSKVVEALRLADLEENDLATIEAILSKAGKGAKG